CSRTATCFCTAVVPIGYRRANPEGGAVGFGRRVHGDTVKAGGMDRGRVGRAPSFTSWLFAFTAATATSCASWIAGLAVVAVAGLVAFGVEPRQPVTTL